MVGGTLGGLLGFEGPGGRLNQLPLRRARRGRHGRGTRHRPRPRAAARRAGRQRRRQRPRRLDRGRRGGRRTGVERRGRDRRRGRDGRRRHQRRRHGRRAHRRSSTRRVEQFGRLDILVNNAGIMRWAGFPDARRRQPREAPRRPRRRLVQHRPRRLAAHGRAGLRPHRDDDVVGGVRAAEQHRRTPRPRVASSGWPAASPPRVRRTASRSTSSRRRRSRAWPARAPAPPQMSPDLVAPMVAFLAHETCPVSGEIYAAGFGRFARIFIASTDGLRPRRARRRRWRTSPQHWATINDEAGYFVPADLMDWSDAFMAHLRDDDGAPGRGP